MIGGFNDAPVVRLYDEFRDSNGTALASHLMNQGSGWTVALGTPNIQSNQLNIAGLDAGLAIAVAEARAADLRASIDLSTANTGGVIARYLDINNWWLAYHDGSNIILIEFQAAVATTRATAASAFSAGDTVTLQCNGSVIEARHKNAVARYASTFNQHATKCGFYADVLNSRFDNLLVRGAP